MKRTLLAASLVFAQLFAWSTDTRTCQAADKVLSDQMLPPHVFVYFSITDTNQVRENWTKSTFGKICEDPGIVDFWKQIEPKLDEISSKLTEKIDISLKSLLNIPQGEIAFAVMRTSEAPLAGALFLDYGGNRADVQKLLDLIHKKAEEEKDVKISTEEIDGTEITIYAPEINPGADVPVKGVKISRFEKDGKLVIATDPSVCKAILARWDGQHDSTFAGQPIYTGLREACAMGDAKPYAVWYLDPIGLVQSVLAMVAQNQDQPNPQLAMFGPMLPVLGLSNLKAIGGTGYSFVDEFEGVSKTMIYAQQPTTGILNLFQCPAAELAPPRWVLADAVSYSTINWNLETAFKAVEGLVDIFQGPGALAAMIDKLAADDDGPQVHIRKDIIDHITGRVHFVSLEPPEPTQMRFIVSLQLKDEEKIKELFTKISKMPGFPAKPREFRGSTIYELPPGLAPQFPASMALGVAQQQLFFVTDVQLLEQILRGESGQKLLVDSPEYRKIAKFYPAQASSISFQKSAAQIRPLYNMLRDNEDVKEQLKKMDIDPAKLPPFESIEKYFPIVGGYMVPDANGAIGTNFVVK